MNCTSISNILQSIDPNQQFQLWGLAYPYNIEYCNWQSMFMRLFTLQDFNPSLTNPLYQAEIIQPQLDLVFFPVCYAYSILRIFMVSSVAVYIKSKMQEILSNDKEQEKSQFRSSSDLSINRHQMNQKFYRYPQPKLFEITFYKWIIYTSMILEIICSIRDFVLFRGTLLFSNLMDQNPYNCWVDFYTDSFTCVDNENIQDSWRSFTYERQDCNCIYFQPIEYTENSDGSYMLFSIVFWIITTAMNQGLIGFTILTLSRLNREETSGWNYLKPTFQKSTLLVLFLIILYTLLIFYFDLPIYYQFFDISVILFYFFWKIVMFILIFDRLYSKIWLELKIRLSQFHSHNIEWRSHLETIKRRILRVSFRNENKFKSIYESYFSRYYNENILPHIERQEKTADAKLKTKWYDYLNYLLMINLIGIIGYGFLMFYGITNMKYSSLFWIGFSLALIELIVFEISNLVFQLHCFFIKMHEQMEQEYSVISESELVQE